MGVVMARKNKRWTLREVEYLRLMYPVARQKVIAKEMEITYSALKNAIQRYRIKKHSTFEDKAKGVQWHIDKIRDLMD
jgi:predicted transcriptional regulator